MKASMLTSFTKVQLHALDRLQKAKNISEMLKQNTNFVRQHGIESIQKNHHNLKWLLFNRVSTQILVSQLLT